MSLSCLGDNPFFQVLEAAPAAGVIYLNEGTGLVDLSGLVTGPEGLPGISGEMGVVGDLGPVGATGDAGSVGNQGPVGSVGAAGSVGPQGSVGAVGSIGPQGPSGNSGTSWEFSPFPVEQPVGSPITIAAPANPTAYYITASPQTGGTDLNCPISLTSSNVGILWRIYNGNDVGNNNMFITFSGAAAGTVQLTPHQALDAMLCNTAIVGGVVLVVRKYLPGT